MTPIASGPRHKARPRRVGWTRSSRIVRNGVTASFAVGVAFLLAPATFLAAATTDCPGAVLPESPAGPALLVAFAVSALGFLAHRRHRRAVTTTVVSALAIVVVCGMLLGTVLTMAATSSCGTGSAASGGVAAASTTTPLTGADIPWITAGVLLLGGGVTAWISRGHRRRRG